MKQTILTMITQVDPSRVKELRDLLTSMGQDVEKNSYIPFTALKLLHFASLVLHEDATYGPYLVFENNFDGPLDDYLTDLYAHASEGLHRIYGYCKDYAVAGADNQEQILSYLRSHVVRPN